MTDDNDSTGNPVQRKTTQTDDQVGTLIDQLFSTSFEEWYRERQVAENIRKGQPYFNGPSPSREPEYHTPSKLKQCHRKIYYQRHSTPEEQSDPEGLYWFGTEFEEALVMEYLSDLVGSEIYVRNSLWIDCTVETEVGELQIKGETDPAIVDKHGKPLLPTEVKTTGIEHLTKPKTKHLAQVHAYLWGLSQKYDRELNDAVILYTHRKTFKTTKFHVEYNPKFWRNTVLAWATTQTVYRSENSLPPANPEQESECTYCDYKHRCGQSDANYADTDVRGLLPLFAEYPRTKVKEYLKANEGAEAKLTPTLAHHYHDLVKEYGVYDWQCAACEATHEWDTVDWDGNTDKPPLCPQCKSKEIPAPLSGPAPAEQVSAKEGTQ